MTYLVLPPYSWYICLCPHPTPWRDCPDCWRPPLKSSKSQKCRALNNLIHHTPKHWSDYGESKYWDYWGFFDINNFYLLKYTCKCDTTTYLYHTPKHCSDFQESKYQGDWQGFKIQYFNFFFIIQDNNTEHYWEQPMCCPVFDTV